MGYDGGKLSRIIKSRGFIFLDVTFGHSMLFKRNIMKQTSGGFTKYLGSEGEGTFRAEG